MCYSAVKLSIQKTAPIIKYIILNIKLFFFKETVCNQQKIYTTFVTNNKCLRYTYFIKTWNHNWLVKYRKHFRTYFFHSPYLFRYLLISTWKKHKWNIITNCQNNLKIQTQFGNTLIYKDLKSLDLRSGRCYAKNFKIKLRK